MKRNRKGLLLAAALFFAAMAAVSGYQLYKISKEYKAGDRLKYISPFQVFISDS